MQYLGMQIGLVLVEMNVGIAPDGPSDPFDQPQFSALAWSESVVEIESGSLVEERSVVADGSEAGASTAVVRRHGEGRPPWGCTLAARLA